MPSPQGARRAATVLACLALATAARAATPACTGFGPAATFAAGATPQMVVAADFDGDGHEDLALACSSGASLQVLRGLGNGAFAAPVAYAAGTGAFAVAASDFNSDGVPDLAVGVSGGVAIWLGRGDGTFSGGAIVPAGSAVRGIACADFNGDGIVDLALASANTNSVLILAGHGAAGLGDGTFGAPVSFAAGTSPARLVAADFDGDGILDVAVANNSSASLSLLRGLGAGGIGNGTFAPAVTLASPGTPWGLAVLDADGDGAPDLAVSNGAGALITVLRNDGTGRFPTSSAFATPTAPRDLVAADFDGDGRVDLAAACAVGNSVCVLRGTGGGSFAPLGTFAAGAGACALAGGDWNGDGIVDLAAANAGAASVSRLLGACAPSAGTGVSVLAPNGGDAWWPGTAQDVLWSRGPGVAAVDVDLSRDGGATWLPLLRSSTRERASVPAIGTPSERLLVRVRDSNVPARADASDGSFVLCGLLRAPVLSAAGLDAGDLAAADLDGDGLVDVVACGSTRLALLRGRGDGRFDPAGAWPAAAPLRPRLADFDGDGRLDLAALEAGVPTVRTGDGGAGLGAPVALPGAGAVDLACGDFDGDGLADLAVLSADPAGAKLEVFTHAAGTWTLADSHLLQGAPGRVLAGDLDGDGIPDLALTAGRTLQLWRGLGAAGRGGGTFAIGTTRELSAAPGELALADVQGTGRLGVVACMSTGDTWAFANTGLETAGWIALAAPRVASAGGTGASPLVADFDGDGQPDLALAQPDAGRLAILAGAGGGYAPPQMFDTGPLARGLLAADVDGDGNPDLLSASPAAGVVICRMAMCPPKRAATLSVEPPADRTLGFPGTLRWSRSPSVPLVAVDLSRDGGAHWTPLAGPLAADSLRWSAGGDTSSRAVLRVRDAAAATRSASGPAFAIRAPLAPGRAVALAPGGSLLDAAADGAGAASVAIADSGALAVLGAAGSGRLEERARLDDAGALAVRLADLDADGVLDLLTLHAGDVTIRRGVAAGGFAAPSVVPIAGPATALEVADVDGDGRPELLVGVAAGDAGRMDLLRDVGVAGGGPPQFQRTFYATLSGPPSALLAGDWNGDDVPDVAAIHGATLTVLTGLAVSGRASGQFRATLHRPFGAGDAAGLVQGDFDGDGIRDLAAADPAGRALWISRGDGAGGFSAPVPVPLPAAPRSLARADFDADGHDDLAVALEGGRLALVRGGGGIAPGGFAIAVTLEADVRGGLALLDADGDGTPDLLGLDPAGALTVWATHARSSRPRLLDAPCGAAEIGDELVLRWSGRSPAVDVQRSDDDGAHWATLAAARAGGSWRWVVGGPAGPRVRLRVRDSSAPALCDTTSAAFAVTWPAAGAPQRPTPDGFALSAPRPNPARGSVAIDLALPRPARVEAALWDLAGRRVRTLLDEGRAAGVLALVWDGRADSGARCAPGLYWLRVRAGDANLVRRIVRIE